MSEVRVIYVQDGPEEDKPQDDKPTKKKKRIMTKNRWILLGILFLSLFALYWLLVNMLVSAALVPSFMRKMDAFTTITEKSYAEQVQTSDIQINRKSVLAATKQWVENADKKRVEIVSDEGYTFVATQFNQEAYSHKWVLLLHGYTGWKEEMYEFAYWYNMQGYHVLVPDLRCQGESQGDFIGMGLTDSKDCLKWIEYINSQDGLAKIVLHGQSMGASTALIMTGNDNLPDNVLAVVSDSAYKDAYSMFSDKINAWFHLPAFPLVDSACLALLMRGGYNLKDASAINAVANSKTPTLFVHGSEDAMIPVEHTNTLFQAATCDKQIMIISGAGHGQPQYKSPEIYYDTIKSFLALYVDGKIDKNMEHEFYSTEINDELKRKMLGNSYPVESGIQIGFEDLRYVHVLHYDFDGNVQAGELVCNKAIVSDLVAIFHNLYMYRYPIESIKLIDEYFGDDEASMSANNSSCFNYRLITNNSQTKSNHALGLAVDINPLYNPYVKNEGNNREFLPKNSGDYVDRNKSFEHKIDKDDICYKLFTQHGFTWGGDWESVKDYQHFEKKEQN